MPAATGCALTGSTADTDGDDLPRSRRHERRLADCRASEAVSGSSAGIALVTFFTLWPLRTDSTVEAVKAVLALGPRRAGITLDTLRTLRTRKTGRAGQRAPEILLGQALVLHVLARNGVVLDLLAGDLRRAPRNRGERNHDHDREESYALHNYLLVVWRTGYRQRAPRATLVDLPGTCR